ncbi:MAG TPA: ABC transporter substrate-binding protein [Desulfarculaceae bacterium]|nr:ABC transporter substrate-binding protein [Desulfarculaceae bacterium]
MTTTVTEKTAMVRCGRFLFVLMLLLTSILGWKESPAANASDQSSFLPIPVFVSIGAHLDFCRQIGGNRVSVRLALPPGKSPETYAPSPRQINDLSRARLFFKVGLPFETAFLRKLKALPRSPDIIDTQAGIKLEPMPGAPYNHDHSKNHERHHNSSHRHEGLDPHTWLDPKLALQQATTIYQTLSRIDPDGKNIYSNNYKILERNLKVLDNELKNSFIPLRGRTIFVYHPAFSYFARAFGLQQRAIEIAGKTPKARDLTEFIKEARTEKIAALFVQPQFDRQSAEKIARALDCAVIGIDPLAADYCANLRHIATTIQANIKVEK